jgi:putative ABC transport system permease protein
MRELLLLLLVLACPLAMFLMMRAGHGHGGHGHTTSAPLVPVGRVPVARRQLLSERAKLLVALLAVAAAVALVLLLTGLRRGLGEQATIYLDHQPAVLVGQAGTRDFLSQTSVLDEREAVRVRRVAGVGDAAPISEGYAMLSLHGKRVLALLVGYDPGRRGGPWQLAEGRAPRAFGELVVDDLLAGEHGLRVGTRLRFRGRALTIVGRSRGTTGFMTPLAFTTRKTANALNEQPKTATFLLVTPATGVSPPEVVRRIEAAVPGVAAHLRDELAARDRDLFVGAFAGPLAAMIAIAGAVAVLVIALTVYSATRDRAHEYATLKAIGLRRQALLRLVSFQAGALAVAGTAIGFGFALAGAAAVGVLAPRYLIALSASDALWMALAALVFALLGALAPARYLDRLDPATAFHR